MNIGHTSSEHAMALTQVDRLMKWRACVLSSVAWIGIDRQGCIGRAASRSAPSAVCRPFLCRSSSSWSRYAWIVGNNLDAMPCTRCTRRYDGTGSREQWTDWEKREGDRGMRGRRRGGDEEAWIRTPRHICTSSLSDGFCSTEADLPDDQIDAQMPRAAWSCVLRRAASSRLELPLQVCATSRQGERVCRSTYVKPRGVVPRAGACLLPRKRRCHNNKALIARYITREGARGGREPRTGQGEVN
jgi:hypothetical protein